MKLFPLTHIVNFLTPNQLPGTARANSALELLARLHSVGSISLGTTARIAPIFAYFAVFKAEKRRETETRKEHPNTNANRL